MSDSQIDFPASDSGCADGERRFGLLTFVSRQFGNQLSPYQYIAAGLAEGLLTLWVLAVGVNVVRWREQAGGQNAMRIMDE